ncbi:hypothetical protein BL253_35890 [Pseudofrankia asymbiotica]|uniref:Uncharacterized protein n=1 Tax=Pseudofrankia asymbiotica TaxID=1834516 RepID=A0A1V2I1U0_9ACTN|nr:hypothetical protein BL253_35890 [Pseudofrankia asymbiotica]
MDATGGVELVDGGGDASRGGVPCGDVGGEDAGPEEVGGGGDVGVGDWRSTSNPPMVWGTGLSAPHAPAEIGSLSPGGPIAAARRPAAAPAAQTTSTGSGAS